MIHIEAQHWEIIKDILGDNIHHFEAFGSRTKGNSRPLSDLDLAYDGTLPDNEIAQIMNAFDDSILPFKVDIVNLRQCSPEFKALILKDRVPLA